MCTICASPALRASVDRFIKEERSLDQISKWTGAARTTIWRHRGGCYAKAEAEQVRARMNPQIGKSCNLAVVLPSGETFFQVLPKSGLPSVTIEVRYESPRQQHDVARDIFGRVEGQPERDIFGNLPEQPAPGE